MVEQAIHRCVAKPHIVDAVAMRSIDAPAFIVPVARFIKQMVEKGSLQKVKMKERFNKLAIAVEEKKSEAKDGIPTTKMDSVRSPSPLTDTCDEKKRTLMTYSTWTSSDE